MAGKAALVPKGPTAHADDFDRDALLAKLFALPVPPIVGMSGRHYPITTPLGRIMRLREVQVNKVAAGEGCPNYRVLSDYLAGRRPISPHHRVALARYLRVDARIF